MDNVERTLKLLKLHTEGLLIKDVASNLKISRNTAAVVIAELKGAGKIRVRELGKCKLIYLK